MQKGHNHTPNLQFYWVPMHLLLIGVLMLKLSDMYVLYLIHSLESFGFMILFQLQDVENHLLCM